MKKLIYLVIIIIFLTSPVSAENENDYGKSIVRESVPEEAEESLSEIGIEYDNGGVLSLSPDKVIEKLFEIFSEQLGKPLKLLGILLGIIMLSAAAEALRDSTGSSSAVSAFHLVSVLACAGMLCGYVSGCITESEAVVKSASTFLSTFTPAFAGIVAANGQTAAAASFNVVIIISAQILSNLASSVVIPLCGSMMGLSIAGAVNTDLKVQRIAEMIKKIIIWMLGIVTTVFTGLLAVQSFIAGSADSLAMKMAKFTVSGTVPIIGGAVSEALTTVKGSLGIIKNSVGTYGIAAVFIIVFPVLAAIAAYKLALTAAAAVGEMFGVQPLAELIRSAENVLSVMIALIVCFLLTGIISTGMILAIGAGG